MYTRRFRSRVSNRQCRILSVPSRIIIFARSIYSRRLAGVFPRKRLRLRRATTVSSTTELQNAAIGRSATLSLSRNLSLSLPPPLPLVGASFTAIAFIESIFLFSTPGNIYGREFTTAIHHPIHFQAHDAYRLYGFERALGSARNTRVIKQRVYLYKFVHTSARAKRPPQLSLTLSLSRVSGNGNAEETHVAISQPANRSLRRGCVCA